MSNPNPNDPALTSTTPQPTTSPPSHPTPPPQQNQHQHQHPNPNSIRTYKFYHAGPLFTQADLLTNILLSRAISHFSHHKFLPVLPQDLEQRGDPVTPHDIRDRDIRALLECDLALFVYDGAELDSGTVVEFMLAKFADVPAVVLRTDFRGGGDQGTHPTGAGDPWNLMSSFYPRTKTVIVDGMMQYKAAVARAVAMRGEGVVDVDVDVSKVAGEIMIEETAKKCVEALEEVLKMQSRMPKELRGNVFEWLALMPGFAEGRDEEDVERMRALLDHKEAKELL